MEKNDIMEKEYRYCDQCDRKKILNENNFRKLWCGLFSNQCKECDKKNEQGNF